jgi:transcriptional regulator with XRE-family HTH domain
MELVDQIKRARLRARLSQEELAALASISRRPIYLLESGRGAVRLDTLVKILDALGLTLQIHPKSPEA